MNMSNSSDRKIPYSEELVAYLDGELDEAGRARVEQRLREDARLRELLSQHQAAWDLLDQLPKTRAGERFTQTTLAMVAVSAAGNVERKQQTQRSRSRLVWTSAVAGAAAAFMLAYWGVTAVVTAPDQRLVQDLPVIENLDAYRHAESLEFLEALVENGLFVAEESSDPL